MRTFLMNLRTLPVFALIVATASVSACHRRTDVAIVAAPETPSASPAMDHEDKRLKEAVNAYAREQNAENDAAVRRAMTDVDSELAELEDLVAKRQGREREKVAARLRRLEAYRSEETTRFAAVQARTSLAPEVLGGPTEAWKADDDDNSSRRPEQAPR